MATREFQQYRGYNILLMRQLAGWYVEAHPTRADLPFLRQSFPAPGKQEAVAEARRSIDHLLISPERTRLHCDHQGPRGKNYQNCW